MDGEGEMKRLNNNGSLHVVLAAGHTGLQPSSPIHVHVTNPLDFL